MQLFIISQRGPAAAGSESERRRLLLGTVSMSPQLAAS
jgi:hypothetical protein